MCVMDIMNVLRTGMNMSISRIHIMGMLQGDKASTVQRIEEKESKHGFLDCHVI